MSLHRWEWLLDAVALVAFLTAGASIIDGQAWLMALALGAAVVALLSRRRFPICAAVVAVLTSGVVLFEPNVAIATWVIAEVILFTLAIRGPRPWTVALAATHGVVLYAGAIVVFGEQPWQPVALILPVWTAAVVATGLALRSNHDHVRALEAQAQSALAFRESEVARHVGEERLRIARDLHDSVAHTVSVISIHAGAAERQLENDPQRARDSLVQVRSSSREVVEELQDILALLRDSGAPNDANDVPGTAAIDALVTATRLADVEVRASIDELPDLDRSVGVAVYRIMQESLTNARKHGTGAVDVSVRAQVDAVVVEVSNGVAQPVVVGSGFGIVGMAERAASVHGELRAAEIDGQFVVRAHLPMHVRNYESEMQ